MTWHLNESHSKLQAVSRSGEVDYNIQVAFTNDANKILFRVKIENINGTYARVNFQTLEEAKQYCQNLEDSRQ